MRREFLPLAAAFALAACASREEPTTPVDAAPETPVAEAPAPSVVSDAAWVELMKQRLPPGWKYFQARAFVILHDAEVSAPWIKAQAMNIALLIHDEFEPRFPPAKALEGMMVFRVCKDPAQYAQYGGPAGTSGYWNRVEAEAVTYYDSTSKKDAGRTLQGLAFHQYLDKAGVKDAPPWFSHGMAEYFAGFDLGADGRFRAHRNFNWSGRAKTLIGARSHVPLREFVDAPREAFLGNDTQERAAEAWALCWFLSQTKDPAYRGLLETYFVALRDRVDAWSATLPPEEPWRRSLPPEEVCREAFADAHRSAFGGFDEAAWLRLEKEWRDFKY
jgi:hypothetical protein